MHVQPKSENKFGCTGGKNLTMKSILFVILTIFMLTGCSVNRNGESIGTQDEPSDQTEKFVPEGVDDAVPSDGNGSEMGNDKPTTNSPDTENKDPNNE